MPHDVKISGARIRTHYLWIRKRVCYPLHPTTSIVFSSLPSEFEAMIPFTVRRGHLSGLITLALNGSVHDIYIWQIVLLSRCLCDKLNQSLAV